MPAPQKTLLAQLAKIFFISKGINLPMDWSQPGEQYPDAFKPNEIAVAPNSPMNLFRDATWQTGLMGPLIYPAFAAFPGPVAPPVPNVPLPLIVFSSPGESGLSPATLKSTMDANLADPEALHASDLFDAISKAFNIIFQIFKVSTMVQNVLGMGPVPSFVPPFVPVGPVVMGSVIPTPGVLV